MRPFKYWMFISALLPAMATLKAQTADEIIAKHFEAIGGKDKIAQIKSIYQESSVQVQGNDAPSTLSILNGKGYRLESEFNGQKIIQVYTDKGGWSINPMAGGTEAVALTDEQYKPAKDQIYIGGPLLNYSSHGNKVVLQGREDDAFKIRETNRDNISTTFYIDPNTFYISKSVSTGTMMGQQMEIIRIFSNYQKTEYGYVIPYTIEISYGGQFSIISNVKKVEINKELDPKIFEMPK
jgi:hypothetical protein